MLLLLTLTALAPAQEAGLDAHGFVQAAADGDPRDPLTLQRPGAFHGGDVFATALVEYADAPLMQVAKGSAGTEANEIRALDDLVAMNLNAGFAFLDQARIDVAMPFYGYSNGLDGAEYFGLGDLRAALTVVPVRPTHVVGGGGLGVGATAFVDAPLGDPARFLGRGKLGGGAIASATWEQEGFTATANLGAQFNPELAIANLTGADQLLAGAAVGWMFTEDTGISGEIFTRMPFAKSSIPGTGQPSEALLSLRQHLENGSWLVLGGGAGLSQGVGAARFRAFLGMGFGKVEPPRDRDKDALADVTVADACPDALEVQNGWKDDDGCPDELGQLGVRVTYLGKDVQGATVDVTGPDGTSSHSSDKPIAFKAVPGSAFSAKAVQDAMCLAGEGKAKAGEATNELVVMLQPVMDATVEYEVVGPSGQTLGAGNVLWRSEQPTCIPNAPYVLDVNSTGSQKVGHGTHTVAVDVPGYKIAEQSVTLAPGETKKLRFVLEPSLVVMEKTQIKILDKVYFEFNKAVIKPESFALLNEVAAVINTHPDVGRVEVAGHTDDKGNDTYNLELSQKRAESVRAYLIGQGVPEAQLLAKGYGETKPIDTNKTETGRGNNRRVEFNLIDQVEEPAPAAPGGTP
jgi:outer membrane protein OmpA-like peptidoglycan-associated protein